jgi:hypothetical protein
LAVPLGGPLRGGNVDFHLADGIYRNLPWRRRRLHESPGAALVDELAHDAQGNFSGGGGADVQASGSFQGGRRNVFCLEVLEETRSAAAAADHRHVGRACQQRFPHQRVVLRTGHAGCYYPGVVGHGV